MKGQMLGLLVCLSMLAGCDKPDEVYEKLPSDFDSDKANGLNNAAVTHEGEKGWDDQGTVETVTGTTVEACTDEEIVAKQLIMVEQPIIPMVGAGGLDQRGVDEKGKIDWSGLNVDEAQSPDEMCQAQTLGDGIVAWGDYYELVAFFNTQTREVEDILVRPGYKGVIKAAEYIFEINEPITRGGVALEGTDNGDIDPRTDANMRAIDLALVEEFRPQLNTKGGYDCVDQGSCYIIMSGTEPVLVFMSVNLYMRLEPTQHRISSLEVPLKRPFGIGMGSFEVEGVSPTVKGNNIGGIPNCEVKYGTKWSHIEKNCFGSDPMDMASITAAYSSQYINVQMGGILLYMQRDGGDAFIPLEPTPEPNDTVQIISVNAGFEGNFSMEYSEVLRIFKANLEEDIRDTEDILPNQLTGIEWLIEPDDAFLPDDVKDRYPDRLRAGGIFAAFCENTAATGPDAGAEDPIYECDLNIDGKPVLPLTNTLKDKVSAALATLGKSKALYADTGFYTQHFLRAIGEYLNGEALEANQMNFTPSSSRPDMIYATIFIQIGAERYTVTSYYGGNDDRLHFFNFQKGLTPTEDVLFQDADISSGGIFSFDGLRRSAFLGLGAKNTVKLNKLIPETRRGELDITVAGNTSTVMAPYLEASSVTGYWVPIQGVQDTFKTADAFSLGGGIIGATFYMSPVSEGSENMEIVSIYSNSFFGNVVWCSQLAMIGDSAEGLLNAVAEEGYPCEMIVRRSENNEFITELYDMDARMMLTISDDMVTTVGTWLR